MSKKENHIAAVSTLELRLGNWILFKHYYQVQVTKLEEDFFTACNEQEVFVDWEENEECSGIPITHELLEKCGFNHELNQPWNIGGFIIDFRKTKWCYLVDTSTYEEGLHTIATFTYFHELQNLYFALTGTELEYEP